jgi:hypothetical protein
MAGVIVRKPNASERKLNRQLSQKSPVKRRLPSEATTSEARNTVQSEYFARAPKLSKRGLPCKKKFTPQVATRISKVSTRMSQTIEGSGTPACKS